MSDDAPRGAEERTNRLDLWLKYVCLFRTRSEAGNAIRGGHVKLNGSRVKPAAIVRTADTIEIRRGDSVQRIEVISLPDRQVPRKHAGDHYHDRTPVRPTVDHRVAEPQRLKHGKLSKKDLRDLRRLKGR